MSKAKTKPFGARLKTLREERDLTQQEVAHGLGITGACICQWETSVSTPRDTARVLEVVGRLCPTRHLIGQLSRTERLALVVQCEELTEMLEALGRLDARAKAEADVASEVARHVGRKLAGDSDPATWRGIRRHVDGAARLLEAALGARMDRIESGDATPTLAGPAVPLQGGGA